MAQGCGTGWVAKGMSEETLRRQVWGPTGCCHGDERWGQHVEIQGAHAAPDRWWEEKAYGGPLPVGSGSGVGSEEERGGQTEQCHTGEQGKEKTEVGVGGWA